MTLVDTFGVDTIFDTDTSSLTRADVVHRPSLIGELSTSLIVDECMAVAVGSCWSLGSAEGGCSGTWPGQVVEAAAVGQLTWTQGVLSPPPVFGWQVVAC